MILNILNAIKTSELIFSNKDFHRRNTRYKNINHFDEKPFLAFPCIDFSDFNDFKNFFSKYGSIYLQGLLVSIIKEVFGDFWQIDRWGIREFGEFYIEKRGNTGFHIEVFVGDKAPSDVQVIEGDNPLKKDLLKSKNPQKFEKYEARNEIIEIYNYAFKYFKENSEKINLPFDLNILESLHNYLYLGNKNYYDNNHNKYRKRYEIIKQIQQELNEYIKIFQNKSSNHTIYNKEKLYSYLNHIIRLNINLEDGIPIRFNINDFDLRNILILELLHYLINKEIIGRCGYCGNLLVIKKRQLRFYNEGKPIYHNDYCQEMAKNKRGNEKKKLQMLEKQ